MKMNRRGGVIGMYLAIAVAFALSVSNLFIFVSFNSNFDSNAHKLTEVIHMYSLEKTYIEEIFYDSVERAIGNSSDIIVIREEFEKIVSERNLGLKIGRDFFDKVEKGEYEVLIDDEKVIFIVPEVRIVSENSAGSIIGFLELRREI